MPSEIVEMCADHTVPELKNLLLKILMKMVATQGIIIDCPSDHLTNSASYA